MSLIAPFKFLYHPLEFWCGLKALLEGKNPSIPLINTCLKIGSRILILDGLYVLTKSLSGKIVV